MNSSLKPCPFNLMHCSVLSCVARFFLQADNNGDYILNYPNHYIFYYQLLVTTTYSMMGSQVYNPLNFL